MIYSWLNNLETGKDLATALKELKPGDFEVKREPRYGWGGNWGGTKEEDGTINVSWVSVFYKEDAESPEEFIEECQRWINNL